MKPMPAFGRLEEGGLEGMMFDNDGERELLEGLESTSMQVNLYLCAVCLAEERTQ